MRTIEEIKGRCRIVDGDDGKEHWIWTGAVQGKDGMPTVRAPDYNRDPTGLKTRPMSVRRAIHMVTKRKPVRAGYMFFQTCRVDGCVNPKCTSMLTKKRAGIHISEHFKTDQLIQAKLSESALRTWDRRGRKISDEVVKQIILSDKDNKEVAKEFGIDPATAWEYRTGRSRKRAARAALGAFAGLIV